jgi:hypothetical protein
MAKASHVKAPMVRDLFYYPWYPGDDPILKLVGNVAERACVLHPVAGDGQ